MIYRGLFIEACQGWRAGRYCIVRFDTEGYHRLHVTPQLWGRGAKAASIQSAQDWIDGHQPYLASLTKTTNPNLPPAL